MVAESSYWHCVICYVYHHEYSLTLMTHAVESTLKQSSRSLQSFLEHTVVPLFDHVARPLRPISIPTSGLRSVGLLPHRYLLQIRHHSIDLAKLRRSLCYLRYARLSIVGQRSFPQPPAMADVIRPASRRRAGRKTKLCRPSLSYTG